MTTAPLPRRFPSPTPEVSLNEYLPAADKRRAAEPAPPPSPATARAIAGALDRLADTIGRETAALEANQPIDLDDVNRRKSQSLLELTRLSRSLTPADAAGLKDRLATLRDVLGDNRRVLELNLTAVREIADLMVGIVGESESDGTYDMARPRRSGP